MPAMRTFDPSPASASIAAGTRIRPAESISRCSASGKVISSKSISSVAGASDASISPAIRWKVRSGHSQIAPFEPSVAMKLSPSCWGSRPARIFVLDEIEMPLDEFDMICDRFTNKKIFARDNRGDLLKDADGNLTKLNDDNP